MIQISITFKNLTRSAKAFPGIIGRDALFRRLIQNLLKPTNHHVAIIGEPGVGKSSLIHMLALAIAERALPHLPSKMFELDISTLLSIFVSGDNPRTSFDALKESIAKLDSAIIVIEDIQLLAVSDVTRLELTLELLQIITTNPSVYLIVTTTQNAYSKTFHDDYIFNRLFSTLSVTELEYEIVSTVVQRSASQQSMTLQEEVAPLIVELGGRYGHGRALPDTALRLLEEATAKAIFDNRSSISSADIHEIISERERIPMARLDTTNRTNLSNLESTLNISVIGQAAAMKTIARTVMHAQIGLSDETKPRGSFLLLGPSGVGKTETAKVLTKTIYSDPSSMVRLDMSEYSEAHSAVRLTGSPPGYVGYEEGGQLTGAISKQPNSLILLDEIEKAHPKLFDVFLQLLDDGRLTDASGKTVDFTHTMVLATSNIGSQEVAAASQEGIDVTTPAFLRETLQPLLLSSFRPEFINRFDAILVYRPLEIPQLISLAQRELNILSSRLARRQITFDVPDEIFLKLLQSTYDPLFGARPIKRLVSNYFEMPIAEQIVNGIITDPTVITGSEPWLEIPN